MNQIRQIRQGDVLLIRRDAPADAKRVEAQGLRVPGERTGHAHVLPAQVYETAEGVRLLHLDEPAILTHEEHRHIVIPAGWWQPVIQREWSPSDEPTPRARFD